ncbi:hypothetical protein EYR40_009248 [Pleurotus pulmonarius]|nr:hypothetical protein EYR36_005383 [Pleurotus pulmonarius]KAF4590652.1 hypothetical protein EYR40_009248 [Pleurotus pulmonarius]
MDPRNAGRWYQHCRQCDYHYWHDPPTPLENVPEDVLIRHAMKRSLADLAPDDPLRTQGLECASPNCRTSGGRNRKANRLCSNIPQLCASCCRVKGGACIAHRDNPSAARQSPSQAPSSVSTTAPDSPLDQATPSLPQGLNEGAMANSVAASPSTAQQTTGADISTTSRTYARPLDPAFAKAYIGTYQKLLSTNKKAEETRKFDETMKNMVVVLMWLKAGTRPERTRIVTKHVGIVVLSEHPSLVSKLNGALAVSIFKSLPPPEWIEQELDVPIQVPRQARILCRLPTLTDAECLELESEQSLLNGNGPPTASQRSKDKLPAPPPPPPPPPPPNPAQDALPPQKFPKVYACDMINGLRQLVLLTLVDHYSLEDAFKISFPNCAYNSKTVYKHKRVFERASSYGIIEDYVDRPRSEEGKWSKLVRDVEVLHAAENATQAPSPSGSGTKHPDKDPSDDPSLEPSKDLSEDASLELSTTTIQRFSLQHGELIASYTADDDSLNTFIEPSPVAKGRIKTVYLGLIPNSAYAIKVINLPAGWWWPQWTSADDAIWVEAARLNICEFQAEVFTKMAADMGVVIYPFKIYATHLFTCKGSFRIGQEWISGNRKCDFSAKDSKLCNETLDALSHYIYQCSGGSTVHVLFQGFQQVQGMAIYDCTTHATENGWIKGRDFLSSDGEAGIQRFIASHVCNEICLSLDLIALS